MFVNLFLFMSIMASCVLELFYCVYTYLKLLYPPDGLIYLYFILFLICILPHVYIGFPASLPVLFPWCIFSYFIIFRKLPWDYSGFPAENLHLGSCLYTVCFLPEMFRTLTLNVIIGMVGFKSTTLFCVSYCPRLIFESIFFTLVFCIIFNNSTSLYFTL